jgi:hypothetical protein
MSGGELGPEARPYEEELVRESVDLSMREVGSMDSVSSRVGLIRHLGPVTRRDRIISMVEQAMPYLLVAVSATVLVLIPALASTISKVHTVDAEHRQLADNLDRVKTESREEVRRVQDLFEKRVNELGSKSGPPGQKGSSGDKGSRGETGAVGGGGPPGLTGAKGDRGEKGQLGDQGDKGEKGLPGPKGDSSSGEAGIPGPKGERGAVGPKGDKGDSFIPMLTWDWSHPSGQKSDRFDFKISCLARCKSLEVIITHSSGDVDLYGEADQVPHIVNSNCAGCQFCKARSSQVKDKCMVDRAPSSTFYITVYAHKDYRKLEVLVEGSNLQNITCVSDNCGGDIKTDLNFPEPESEN